MKQLRHTVRIHVNNNQTSPMLTRGLHSCISLADTTLPLTLSLAADIHDDTRNRIEPLARNLSELKLTTSVAIQDIVITLMILNRGVLIGNTLNTYQHLATGLLLKKPEG